MENYIEQNWFYQNLIKLIERYQMMIFLSENEKLKVTIFRKFIYV